MRFGTASALIDMLSSSTARLGEVGFPCQIFHDPADAICPCVAIHDLPADLVGCSPQQYYEYKH